jgi:hypothetical protein
LHRSAREAGCFTDRLFSRTAPRQRGDDRTRCASHLEATPDAAAINLRKARPFKKPEAVPEPAR